MAFAKVEDDAVSVAIEEVTPGDWTEKVYEPDILNSPASSTRSRDTIPFHSNDCSGTAPPITGDTYD